MTWFSELACIKTGKTMAVTWQTKNPMTALVTLAVAFHWLPHFSSLFSTHSHPEFSVLLGAYHSFPNLCVCACAQACVRVCGMLVCVYDVCVGICGGQKVILWSRFSPSIFFFKTVMRAYNVFWSTSQSLLSSSSLSALPTFVWSFINTPSSLTASWIHMDIGQSTGAWVTSQDPQPWKKWTRFLSTPALSAGIKEESHHAQPHHASYSTG